MPKSALEFDNLQNDRLDKLEEFNVKSQVEIAKLNTTVEILNDNVKEMHNGVMDKLDHINDYIQSKHEQSMQLHNSNGTRLQNLESYVNTQKEEKKDTKEKKFKKTDWFISVGVGIIPIITLIVEYLFHHV